MPFIPLFPYGDDTTKAELPLASVGIIVLCSVVFAYQLRLMQVDVGIRQSASITLIPEATDATSSPRFGYQHYDDEDYDLEEEHQARPRSLRVPFETMAFNDTWGLVPEAMVEERQLHGLITHQFLHGSLDHIFSNMITFWAFAFSLEAALGPVGIIVVFLLSGIAGGLAHAASCYVFNANTDLPLIGASGAVFGIIGAYFALFGIMTKIRFLFLYWLPYPRIATVNIPAPAMILLMLLQQVIEVSREIETGEHLGIAWFAHLGGFFGGVAVMLLIMTDQSKVLIRDRRDGELKFAEVNKPSELNKLAGKPNPAAARTSRAATMGAGSAGDSTAEAAPTTVACPACNAIMDASHQISERLYQCPECKKLTYL